MYYSIISLLIMARTHLYLLLYTRSWDYFYGWEEKNAVNDLDISP